MKHNQQIDRDKTRGKKKKKRFFLLTAASFFTRLVLLYLYLFIFVSSDCHELLSLKKKDVSSFKLNTHILSVCVYFILSYVTKTKYSDNLFSMTSDLSNGLGSLKLHDDRVQMSTNSTSRRNHGSGQNQRPKLRTNRSATIDHGCHEEKLRIVVLGATKVG